MRKVFYSFHYKQDNWRVQQIRNIKEVDGTPALAPNKWEELKRSGDKYVKSWIDNNLRYRSCTVVLIGEHTANRKWVRYEIKKSWKMGKGVIGIHIHNLKNQYGDKSRRGKNPFVGLYVDGVDLGTVVPVYNPVNRGGTSVYNQIRNNIKDWVENGIDVRSRYPGFTQQLYNNLPDSSYNYGYKSKSNDRGESIIEAVCAGLIIFGIWAFCKKVNGVDTYTCPHCGTKLMKNSGHCPNCNTVIQWA